ncbi:MAG: exodeoxyribonuclease VII large subunit [Ruminococcaceae bacterium]|nr:exodeoxyribonuclease VII large subunit [Oscillospiraceae bacterium]
MISVKPTVYSVAQLNAYVKNLLDDDAALKQIFVTGEISNYKAHYSGHHYMTIKDESASIKAVMFAGQATKLRFVPENGMRVLILGTVSLFPRDGSYQLYISDMQPDGAGALNVAYEQLKKKLEAEGLFSQAHKKPLPRFPQRVGVVTSETGAAVQDIFNVLKRRYPLATVVLRPCKVQGDGAAEDIASAIDEFNIGGFADVLIVGRGGGSIEDLWAFNEEIVARAVYNSKIPVISAVGHETDYTICDFVADLRAPTPSAAAECAVPDIKELKSNILQYRQQLFLFTKNIIEQQRQRLSVLEKNTAFRDPSVIVNENRKELVYLSEKLFSFTENALLNEKNKISHFAGKLDALSPLGVISRGYAIAKNNDKIISKITDVKKGDEITVSVSDGNFKAVVL